MGAIQGEMQGDSCKTGAFRIRNDFVSLANMQKSKEHPRISCYNVSC